MPKQKHDKKSKNKRCYEYCATVYGVKPEKLEWMRYLCTGRETCPTTGRQHWQTYFYLSEAMTHSAVKKSFPEDWKNPWFASCKGDYKKNRDYCSKDGEFYEAGIPPEQGKRTDFEKAIQELKAGGMMAVTNESLIVRYKSGFTFLRQLHLAKQAHQFKAPAVYWHYGPTGKLKTKTCYDFDAYLYRQTSNSGWFDGYFGQKTLLIDDYQTNTNRFTLEDLLYILDGYEYDCKVKCGFVRLAATTVFITSREHPRAYFEHRRYPEIERRITKVIEYGGVSITSPTSMELLPPQGFQNK